MTIEVGVPCSGCRQNACLVRQRSPRLNLAASDLQPGEPVRLDIGATDLTRICLALFGPPLILLLLAGWLTAAAVPDSSAVALSVAAGLTGLVLGAGLGRRLSRDLSVEVSPMAPVPGRTPEVRV